MSRDAGPTDREIWRILAMGRHRFGDSHVIGGITRESLARLSQVVEFARLARGFSTFGFDHDRRGRFRVLPHRITHADILKTRWGALNPHTPPMQQFPRRSR